MKVYTYSEARQNLASLLKEAQKAGAVRIRRRDGQTFLVKPDRLSKSPFDVRGIKVGLTRDEVVAFVHAGRRKVRS